MERIENENGVFVELPEESITFAGNTDEEKRLNRELFYTILELNRFQDGNRELRNFLFDLLDEGIGSVSIRDVIDHLEL